MVSKTGLGKGSSPEGRDELANRRLGMREEGKGTRDKGKVMREK